MQTKLIVVDAQLSGPPSLTETLRALVIYSTVKLECQVFFGVSWDTRDFYYNWLKSSGLLDFNKEIVFWGDSVGAQSLVCSTSDVWADWQAGSWQKIVEVDRVVPENLSFVLARI